MTANVRPRTSRWPTDDKRELVRNDRRALAAATRTLTPPASEEATDESGADRDLERRARSACRPPRASRASTSSSSAGATSTRCSTAGACTGARCSPTAHIDGDDLICGLHGWDYRIDTGVSAYNNAEALEKFTSVVDGDDLFVDRDEVIALEAAPPAAVRPRRVPGLYTDPHGTIEEPFVMRIHELAAQRPDQDRPPRVRRRRWACRASSCPTWDDDPVRHRAARAAAAARRRRGRHRGVHRPERATSRCGSTSRSSSPTCPSARCRTRRRPRWRAARSSRAPASARARAACCPRSRPRTRRYFYELASARFGWTLGRADARCRPSTSSSARAPRPAPAATCPARRSSAASPRCAACPKARRRCRRRRFPDWHGVDDFRRFADEVRERSRAASRSASSCRRSTSRPTSTPRSRSASTTSSSTAAAAAPARRRSLFRDNISVPTIPALGPGPAPSRPARPARRHAGRHRRPARRGRLRQGARARRRRGRDRELRDPGHRLSRHARLSHRQLPGRHRDAEAAPAGPACRSTRPRSDSTGSCARRSSSCRCSPGRAGTTTCRTSRSTTSRRSTATWPQLTGIAYGGVR